ncbi:MAG TPA: MlaD family protein [Gemmatimonadales bacterium]|jgi:ABC-type transporter Mla subunit MlaD
MRTRTADALIGLLVIGALVITVAAFIVTRGWTERRVTIYMLSPSVQDLKQDTPVYLQGLAIGEVASISPRADSGLMGAPQFIVALRLRERFANGVPIRLPLGTSGKISSSGLIGAASVSLTVPPIAGTTAIQPGDTIQGDLTQGWSEGLKEVVDSLKTQVSDILHETRALMANLDRTASTARTELATTAPELRATLSSARQTLEKLQPMIEQARTTVVSTDQRMGTLQDSLTLLLADTRRLINSADTLTSTVTGLTNDMAPDLRRTVSNIYVVSAKLDRFIDQVSRRPHRLLTGVHQPPRDSILQNDQ